MLHGMCSDVCEEPAIVAEGRVLLSGCEMCFLQQDCMESAFAAVGNEEV